MDIWKGLTAYGKKRWRQRLPVIALLIFCNLYFGLFIQEGKKLGHLLYLDFLFLLPLLGWWCLDYFRFRKGERELQKLLEEDFLICRNYPEVEDGRAALHDVQVLEEQLKRQFEESCELQDYVARWCHELKIPLAAALLMAERIPDTMLGQGMRRQLERMNSLLNSLLLGCRLQSPLFDLQVERVNLSDCVKTSIRNNRFFLIQEGFSVEAEVGGLWAYTDPAWLVYVLDQLLGNAVKYRNRDPGCGPRLRIWGERREGGLALFVEDNGEGIRPEDIRRIFEKGYTGKNGHNGKYKSTGMGLYLAEKIICRLGHTIQVESEYGKYTRFCLEFEGQGSEAGEQESETEGRGV